MKPKAFLSCSFLPGEEPVRAFFHDLLQECGYEVLWAIPEDSPSILGKVFPKIEQADLAIGIFTRRNKLEGKDSWTAPPAVIYELADARRCGKGVYGLVEKGIDRSEIGLLRFHETNNFPEFDRDTLYKEKSRFRGFFCSFPELERAKVQPNYRFLQYVKDLTIYENGYGVVRVRITALSHNENWKNLTHFFGLRPCAKKDSILPDFNTLKQNPVGRRWDNQAFFNFRLLDAYFSEDELDVHPESGCTEDRINFGITFKSGIKAGTKIAYEWSWGFPDMFPLTEADLEPGKRKADEDRVISSIGPIRTEIDSIVLVARFEGRPQFAGKPTVRILDGAMNPLSWLPTLDEQKSTLYTSYVGQVPQPPPSAFVRVDWVPK